MDVFHSSFDLLRLVFLFGAVVALVWKKRLGITPGGIIIPGVLALLLDRSVLLFVTTLATAAVCWLVYALIFGPYALSQRWAALITMSMSVAGSLGVIALAGQHQEFSQETLLLSAIAPGLIALSARRYGLAPALHHTLAATAVTYTFGWVLASLLPYGLLGQLTNELAGYKPLALANLYVTLPVSMLSAIATYHFFRLRSGGYMIAPFVAVVIASSPIQAGLLGLGVATSYLIVRTVQRFSLIIGLERFVLSLFSAYFVISLIDLIASRFVIPGYQAAPIILMTAVAVMTNDLCLQPIKATLSKGFSPTLVTSLITRVVA